MVEAPKHTPSPWTIIPAVAYDGDDDDLAGAYTSPAGIEGSDGNPVCVFGTAEGSGTLFENEADYSLIAAAPDLLEALKALQLQALQSDVNHPSNEWGMEALALAHAAIAKAEGRSHV
jgi:hypothetical protein